MQIAGSIACWRIWPSAVIFGLDDFVAARPYQSPSGRNFSIPTRWLLNEWSYEYGTELRLIPV